MSLEGRLRDLGPLELCQMLATSRKTGVLVVHAPLHARAAEIRFLRGTVVDASQWPIDPSAPDALMPRASPVTADARTVQTCVLDLLTWRDGDFRFVAEDAATKLHTSVRISLEPLLVEAAQRAEVWERVADRVVHPRVIPAFLDVEPQQLPLLRLVPQEWEVLTRVDGRRDLTALADVLGRDLLDIAQIVHGLIGAGLLTLREPGSAPRRHPTPPAQSVVDPSPDFAGQTGDLWIPAAEHRLTPPDEAALEDDSIFDPVSFGVLSADGMPRCGSHANDAGIPASVASSATEPSEEQSATRWPTPNMDAMSLCVYGDDAARSGDLAGALTFWSAALRSVEPPADADRIREAIALAARLHALLHPIRVGTGH